MHANPAQVKLAAEALRRGETVAFPTETVYGLGANAFDASAVQRVFALKARPLHNPLIVHVTGQVMARSVTTNWSELAQKLASVFWPGPLSIVVQRNEAIPDIVAAGGPTVCVRCPDHPVALALIEAAEIPLVGPSANRSGEVSPTTADHVREAFPEVLVVDGGPCRIGIESTVVKIDGEHITILRPGVIGQTEIQNAAGVPVSVQSEPNSDALESPGQLSRHYAPKTPAIIVSDIQPLDLSQSVVIAQEPVAGTDAQILMPRSAKGYAASLYDALRRADAMRMSRIIILNPTGPGELEIWQAIRDRLGRACSEREGQP